jgi:hypothetical protein
LSLAVELILAALAGGIFGQVASVFVGRRKRGADAADVITQAAARLITNYVQSDAELYKRVEKAEHHAILAVADAFAARQAEERCTARLQLLEEEVARLSGRVDAHHAQEMEDRNR